MAFSPVVGLSVAIVGYSLITYPTAPTSLITAIGATHQYGPDNSLIRRSGRHCCPAHRDDCICSDLVNALTGGGGSERIVGRPQLGGDRTGLGRRPGRQPDARRGPGQHHTLTWVANSGVSSGRLYRENNLGFFDVKGASVPAAVERLPSRALSGAAEMERAAYPNLIYFNEVDKGNHFAAW